jgi:hypothetical protein
MDPRAIKLKDVPLVSIPLDRVLELSSDSTALQAYIDAHLAANNNEAVRPAITSADQLKIQQAMIAAVAQKPEITAEDLAVQHQPFRLLPVYQASALQQHSGGIALTAEQRAANEMIRQRQYAAQIAMLANPTLTP